MASLSDLVIAYIDRVVNGRDITGVDQMVAPEYCGTGPGWPSTLGQLRHFYEEQIRERPNWRIEVRQTLELGDSVVVRAHAYGTAVEEGGPRPTALDWLTHYRFVERRITEINLLTVVSVSAN